MKHKVLRAIAGSKSRRSERGATATEYGILVSFIAMALLTGVGFFGTELNDMFDGFGIWVQTNL